MPAEQIKDLCKLTRDRLKVVNEHLEGFLNGYHIPKLLEESDVRDEETETYLKEYVSDLRHLLVACEIGYEKVSLVLRRAKFNPAFAEKVLHEVVHVCIYNFYYPRNEVYEEDGRYCYTAQDAIRFRQQPPESLRKLTLSLSKVFEELRDELEYYETDYETRMRMQQPSLIMR
jgi:hypothetical protein